MLSSRPPIFPRTKGPGMENGACRDPGATARALMPGSRDADFCYQIEDLDKNRTRDDNVWKSLTNFLDVLLVPLCVVHAY